MRSFCAVLVLCVACGKSSGSSDSGPPAVDAGVVPCEATISGVYGLSDAGFDCATALVAAKDGGLSLALVAAGALPDPILGVDAVVRLSALPAGGSPLALPDGGTPDAGSFAIPGGAAASATAQIFDGQAYALDSAQPLGRGRLTFTYVSDAGHPEGDTLLYAAHGVFDAQLLHEVGVPPAGPDGGPIDAGAAVLLHATF